MFAFALACGVFGAASVAVLPVSLAFTTSDRPSETPKDLLASVAVGSVFLALAAACVALARRAVVVTEDGVELRTLVVTRRWTWSQIDRVEIGCEYDEDEGMKYWPRLLLSTGERVDLQAVTSSNRHVTSATAQTSSAIRRGLLAHRRSIRAEMLDGHI
jgi:hypothetical protein